MPNWITAWLDGLPATTLALYCSMFFVALTWFGIIFLKPVLRLWLRKQHQSNELVNYTSAGFSLFYGLLLGLLSVATYQNTKDVENAASREASSLSAIYRTSAAYPEPLRSELQYLIRDYTLYVINKDWPAHLLGRSPTGGEHRLQVIRVNLFNFEPADKRQEILHVEVLRDFSALVLFREQRTSGVMTAIPRVLWYVVLIGAFIHILPFWMLNMRFMVHLILGGIVSFFLGVMIFLIYAMDHPLRGEVSVTPDAFRSVYELVMRWDEST